MLLRPLLVAAALTWTSTAMAAAPARQAASFVRLHRESSVAPVAEGLEVHLAEGALTLKLQALQLDPQTRLEGVTVTAPLDTSGGFMAAPLSTMVAALTEHCDIQVARFVSEKSSLYELSDMQITMRSGVFELRAKKGVTLKATGLASWSPDDLRLGFELTKIKAGFVTVPRAVAFSTMSRILTADFVELANPNIYMKLAPFLR